MPLRWSKVFAAVSSLGVVAAPVAHGQDSVVAFVDVSVIPMDRERILPNHTILVQNRRILALGPANQVPVPTGARRIEGQGMYVIPGLGDCHVHLGELTAGQGGFNGWRQHPSVDDLLLSFVANGVTTVREMHGGPTVDGNHWAPALREEVAQGRRLGPRIYVAGDPDESSPLAAAQSVKALKAGGYDFVKFAHPNDTIYDSIVTAARREGLPVVGHALSVFGPADRLGNALAHRWSSVEHLLGYYQRISGRSYFEFMGLGQSGEALPEVADSTLRRVAQETKAAGVWNCPTPAIRESNGVDPFDRKATWERAFDRRLIKALHESGAGLLLGTDAGGPQRSLWMPVGGFAIHRGLELLVEAGLTPYQALEAGTKNMAQFLKTLDSTGTIAVGKRADLVLLRANPLVDVGATRTLAGVMVQGRWWPQTAFNQRIDSLRPSPEAPVSKFGTTDVQLRMLRRMVWR